MLKFIRLTVLFFVKAYIFIFMLILGLVVLSNIMLAGLS